MTENIFRPEPPRLHDLSNFVDVIESRLKELENRVAEIVFCFNQIRVVIGDEI